DDRAARSAPPPGHPLRPGLSLLPATRLTRRYGADHVCLDSFTAETRGTRSYGGRRAAGIRPYQQQICSPRSHRGHTYEATEVKRYIDPLPPTRSAASSETV